MDFRQMDHHSSKVKNIIGSSKHQLNSLLLLEQPWFENMIGNRFYNNNSQLKYYKALRNELLGIESLISKEVQIR